MSPSSLVPRPSSLTGGQIMCEALVRQGVDVIFGIPGGAIMPFYDALYGFRDRLRHVLCRHEQGAGHAAEDPARMAGRLSLLHRAGVGRRGERTSHRRNPLQQSAPRERHIHARTSSRRKRR